MIYEVITGVMQMTASPIFEIREDVKNIQRGEGGSKMAKKC